MSLAGQGLPTCPVQQVSSYLGYSGRGANALGKAALAPKRTSARAGVTREVCGFGSPSPSADTIAKAIRRDLLSCKWSKKPITEVTKADVLSMVLDIKADRNRYRGSKRATPASKAFRPAR